jgi:hypothetical protein
LGVKDEPYETRLILMGNILVLLGTILLIARGFSLSLIGLHVTGIVLAAVELIWKASKEDRDAI